MEVEGRKGSEEVYLRRKRRWRRRWRRRWWRRRWCGGGGEGGGVEEKVEVVEEKVVWRWCMQMIDDFTAGLDNSSKQI